MSSKKLIREIEHIQKTNHEKEESLNDIEKERNDLQGDLLNLEKENADLKGKLLVIETDVEDVKCFGEELDTIESDIDDVKKLIGELQHKESHNVSIQCDPCDENVEKECHLNNHQEKKPAKSLMYVHGIPTIDLTLE